VEENREPTTTENDDVEAHGVVEKPMDRPMEASSEEPDVEGHVFAEKPVERPVE
jgi:hypothetical protein